MAKATLLPTAVHSGDIGDGRATRINLRGSPVSTKDYEDTHPGHAREPDIYIRLFLKQNVREREIKTERIKRARQNGIYDTWTMRHKLRRSEKVTRARIVYRIYIGFQNA